MVGTFCILLTYVLKVVFSHGFCFRQLRQCMSIMSHYLIFVLWNSSEVLPIIMLSDHMLSLFGHCAHWEIFSTLSLQMPALISQSVSQSNHIYIASCSWANHSLKELLSRGIRTFMKSVKEKWFAEKWLAYLAANEHHAHGKADRSKLRVKDVVRRILLSGQI